MFLMPGEPPLPGLDRFGRTLPPQWYVRLKRFARLDNPYFVGLLMLSFFVVLTIPDFFT